MRTSVLIAVTTTLGGFALMYPTLAETFDLPGHDRSRVATTTAQGIAIKSNGQVSGQVAQLNVEPDIQLLTTDASLPARGTSMKQVESEFGAPVSRKAPVGDPPITRWEYQNFIVYFEYRHVIHAVAKR